MEIYLYPAGPEYSDDLQALGRELHELDIVDTVTGVRQQVEPGRLGGGLVEVLVVALGAGGTVTVLVNNLVGILRNRRGPKVRISAGPDGTVVDVDIPARATMSEIRELVVRIVEQIEKPDA